MADDPPDDLLGSVVAGKYRVERVVGRGGMGAVYQATNVAIGKRVAIKFLDAVAARDSDAVTRFQREAEAASLVESAHIVQIFDSGHHEGRPYLVMELLQGEDLRAWMRRDGRLDAVSVAHVIGQVLRALVRAHAAGIVHRDLKPDNVFLCDRDDDPRFVKLVDFGISKVSRAAAQADVLTRRGTVLGTAYYMSPEQAQAFADVDGRADLYSVGAIAFEALAGEPPHQGPTYEAVLIDICTRDAQDVRTLAPDVPEAFARVIARALARERDARFQDAAAMHRALEEALPGALRAPVSAGVARRHAAAATAELPQVTATGTAVSTRVVRARAARRTWVAALVAALGAFALTAWLLGARRDEPRPEPAGAAERPAASVAASALVAAIVEAPAPLPAASASGHAADDRVAPRRAHVPAASSAPPARRPPGEKKGVAGGLELVTDLE